MLLNAMDHGGKFDPEETVEVHRIRTEHSIIYLIRDPSAGFYLSARLTRPYPTPWRSLLPTLFIPGTSRGRTAARTAGEHAPVSALAAIRKHSNSRNRRKAANSQQRKGDLQPKHRSTRVQTPKR